MQVKNNRNKAYQGRIESDVNQEFQNEPVGSQDGEKYVLPPNYNK